MLLIFMFVFYSLGGVVVALLLHLYVAKVLGIALACLIVMLR